MTEIYRDPAAGTEARVADLLARMTVAEKVGQLGSAWVFELVTGSGAEFTLRDGAVARMSAGLGQVTRISGAGNVAAGPAARIANTVQHHLVTATRLGIPAIVHEEVCAGLMARDATVFPQPLGLACSWRPELVARMADVVRRVMRASGAHQGLSPVLEVCCDPRWGRIEETFGEDPQLVARFGVAFVEGLQGSGDDAEAAPVLATAKHFVGYGASVGGLNWAPAMIPPRELREVHLAPFEAAVRAGLGSVMHGYHELDGVPCAANRALLTGLLREEWGFAGIVVADYFGVRQLDDYHGLAEGAAEAAAMALHAGIDVELPSTDCYGPALVDAVERGAVALSALDRAVARVLGVKFRLGLFERPYVDADAAPVVVGSPASAALAAEAAAASLVLLRNEGVLPLPASVAHIAVIGPNADDPRCLFGDYSYLAHVETLREMRVGGGVTGNVFGVGVPQDLDLDDAPVRAISVLDAVRAAFPAARVTHAPGCAVNSPDTGGFAAAVAAAESADVAIVVVGDRSGLTDEATVGEGRDRSSLDLPGVQEEMVAAVAATGTPVVVVLITGRPCGSERLHASAAAVVAAWLPGPAGAGAIAAVLAGTANPGGKLAVSFARSAGHVPVGYRQKRSGGRSHWKGDYVDGPTSALYPFGHGLSYTTFRLAARPPAPEVVAPEGSVTVQVDVANTGDRAGDEVVQVYVRDPRASITRPQRELAAFQRVALDAGAAACVTFTIPVAQLGLYDGELRYVVEPGEIEVYVGPASDRLVLAGSFTVATGGGAVGVTRRYDWTSTVAPAPAPAAADVPPSEC